MNQDEMNHDRRPAHKRHGERATIAVFFVAIALTPNWTFGQTTRTSPSSAATSKSIPAAASTSPNSPCSNTNPNSPCYSANAPRNPCFSAVAPEQPCSTTVTPNSTAASGLPTSPPPEAATTGRNLTERAITADQAKSQIEGQGYANVSGLRKDAKGVWRGKAVKEGVTVNVSLDSDGKITAN
jgi:hypothetical protein